MIAFLSTARAPFDAQDRLVRGLFVDPGPIERRQLSGAVHQMLELDPRDRFLDAGRALVKIRQRGTEVYSPDLLGELIFPDGRRLAMRRHDYEWIPT